MYSKAGKINKIFHTDNSVFCFVSIIFALMFICAGKFGDDVSLSSFNGKSIIECFQQSFFLYKSWSSRVLVNAIAFIMIEHSILLWPIYMGISIFVMMKALFLLFIKDNVREGCYCIACMVMMFPFHNLYSAGWIATTTTYFGPPAFGLLSLVPIKKIYYGETFRWWEYVLYAVSLIYGANIEQMMVVIVSCYAIACIYFALQRKNSMYCIFLFLLSAASSIITFGCPGNYNRKQEEAANWFPTYGMMNEIDKADIGLFTTIKGILFDNNMFVICICISMVLFMWKKYNEKLLRGLALFPVFITVGMGPFKNILTAVYPSLSFLADDIPYYGLVTVENRGSAEVFGKYLVMCFTVIFLGIEIFMLLDNYEQFMVSLILLSSGAASRAAIGFSPTIYASGNRTFAVFDICIIAIGVLLYTENIQKGLISITGRMKILFFMKLSLFVSFLYLWFVVSTVK